MGKQKIRYGFHYPNNVKGAGYLEDVLAFFSVAEKYSPEITGGCESLLELGIRPVYGARMFKVFEEAKRLESRLSKIEVDAQLLMNLNIDGKDTRLKANSQRLSGVFERFFAIVAYDAPGFIGLSRDDAEWINDSSIRVGPVEPLMVCAMFSELPAHMFEGSETPLWSRDEVLDSNFYKDIV